MLLGLTTKQNKQTSSRYDDIITITSSIYHDLTHHHVCVTRGVCVSVVMMMMMSYHHTIPYLVSPFDMCMCVCIVCVSVCIALCHQTNTNTLMLTLTMCASRHTHVCLAV